MTLKGDKAVAMGRLILNLSNLHFRAGYLSDDELALVKEEIIVDIDVMDMMDYDSQDNTSDDQQYQQDIDVVDCDGPSNECEPDKKSQRLIKK